jgi:putative selenate reductase FAD-binding subunit
MTIREYLRAQSMDEALTAAAGRRNAVLGGGTWLRLENRAVETAVDLSGLKLDTIEETADAWILGAMVTLRAMEKHEGLNAATHGLCAQCVSHIVGVQFRACATVGGSVWGRFGFSEVLTAFMALDADVELARGGWIRVEDFARMKPDDDILLHVRVKKDALGAGMHSLRAQETDFPILAVAAVRRADGLRLCVGARPGRAACVSGTDAKTLIARAQEELIYDTNARASAAYRRHLAGVLSRRALEEACQ